ncbi:MAG: hypothetical protein ACR2PL_07005 [Dehalococcoidia bacterium]
MNKHSQPPERAARFYALLLRMYPEDHRRAFGAQMLRTFKDQHQELSGHRGKTGLIFWLALVSDEAKNIAKERLVVVRKSFGSGAASQPSAEHVWMREGLCYGAVLGLLWVALNLARYLSANESSLRETAKSLDLGIILLGMPALFGLAGFISGRRSGSVHDGLLAGLLAAVTGAAVMVLSFIVIMALFWDTVRGNAFQTAEMIRAWHASGDPSFDHYLWGDNLGGALTMTIVAVFFGGLLGTLGGALGASLPRQGDHAGRTMGASGERIG